MAGRQEQQEERITSRTRILPLLQRLKDTRTVLMVHFPNDNVSYNSALLDINVKTGAITLDELVPRGGHEKLLAMKRLHITGRLAGAAIRFKGELVDVLERDGIFRYQLPIPDLIVYQQRRSAFRARVPAELCVPVTLLLADAVVGVGELIDLSSGGIGFWIDKELGLTANDGNVYTCQIALPTGGTLAAEMEMRFVGDDANDGKVTAGGRFLNINGPLQNAIDRFVMYLQREIIRRSREAG